MPRLGDEPPSRHRRVFLTMAVGILVTIFLVGASQFSAASTSVPAWMSEIDDDVDATGRRKHHRKLDGLTMMEALPTKYIPTADNGRRLIIIGDIHGMDKALDKLLDHVSYSKDTDHIVAAGDMINKGPHSGKVISRLMDLGASAVRGNHEDNVLLALASVEEQQEASLNVTYPEFQTRRSKKADLTTARQLSKEQIKWLAERPLILSLDDLAMYIVHAGLVPGIRPAKQDPWAVMNMRSLIEPSKAVSHDDDGTYEDEELSESPIDEDMEDTEDDLEDDTDLADSSFAPQDLIPVDTHEGQKWARFWDRRQARLQKSSRRTVVYGHDAKRGLTVGRYTFGLDSACVNGGELTALVLRVSKKGNLKSKIRQVPCKKDRR